MKTAISATELVPAGNAKKRQLLDQISKQIGDNRDILFANYRGLNVELMDLLRRQVQRHNAMVCVIKNRLVMKALIANGKTDSKLEDVLQGPTAVVLANDNGMKVLQDIVEFNANSADIPCGIKGAFIENMFYSAEGINKIKDLPSREILLAQLMSMMLAPIRVMTQLMHELVVAPVRLLSKVGQNKHK